MKIPVTNNGTTYLAVGSTLIPPGETRHFEEQDVPHYLRTAAEEAKQEEAPVDPLAELLKGNVASVSAALAELSDADIERLGELEQTCANPRKTLLSAIAEALLTRAANNGQG